MHTSRWARSFGARASSSGRSSCTATSCSSPASTRPAGHRRSGSWGATSGRGPCSGRPSSPWRRRAWTPRRTMASRRSCAIATWPRGGSRRQLPGRGRIYRGPRGSHDELGAHLWSQLAEDRLAARETQGAEEAVVLALEAAHGSLHARLARAQVSGARGRRREARRGAFELIEEAPWTSAIALPWLWELHEQAGALGELAIDFEPYSTRVPLHPQAALLHARLLRQEGRLGDAAQALRTLLQASPGFLGARHELGQVLLSAGQTADFSRGVPGASRGHRERHHRRPMPSLRQRRQGKMRWRCPSCHAFDWFEEASIQPEGASGRHEPQQRHDGVERRSEATITAIGNSRRRVVAAHGKSRRAVGVVEAGATLEVGAVAKASVSAVTRSQALHAVVAVAQIGDAVRASQAGCAQSLSWTHIARKSQRRRCRRRWCIGLRRHKAYDAQLVQVERCTGRGSPYRQSRSRKCCIARYSPVWSRGTGRA